MTDDLAGVSRAREAALLLASIIEEQCVDSMPVEKQISLPSNAERADHLTTLENRKLSTNLAAFIAGQLWRAFIMLAFVPTYIKILGAESYGLIGIMSTLQIWLILLDFGLRPTLVREMARYVGGGCDHIAILKLYRTIEITAFVIALLILAGLAALSPWLATHWVQARSLSQATTVSAFAIMGFVAATQLMESVYVSSLIGLQRQVVQNYIITISVTARVIGALFIISFVSSTVIAFFIWQGLVSLVTCLYLKTTVRGLLPSVEYSLSRFYMSELVRVRGYAGGIIGMSLLSLLITQLDKIFLANRLPLDQYGYYVLAGSVATAMSMITTPIGNTFLPRLTELVELGRNESLQSTFRQLSQLISICVWTASAVMILYADNLLYIWTGSISITLACSDILRFLAAATAISAISSVPYLLQLSYGWTGMALRINIVAATTSVPLLFFMMHYFGVYGAATTSIMVNLLILVAYGIFTFRRFLIGHQKIWFFLDVLLPFIVIATVVGITRLLLGDMLHDRALGALVLAIVTILTLLAGLAAAPLARSMVTDTARQALPRFFNRP